MQIQVPAVHDMCSIAVAIFRILHSMYYVQYRMRQFVGFTVNFTGVKRKKKNNHKWNVSEGESQMY